MPQRERLQREVRVDPVVQASADPARDARLTVLIGDPILDSEGEPLTTDWRLPYERLAARLAEALVLSGRRWTLELQPATVACAARQIPKSRFVVILCHGDVEGLAFESDVPAARLQPLLAEGDLRPFFASAPPEIVLVLACQAEAAARAIHACGVPLALAIDKSNYLWWTEAVDLAATFFAALAADHLLPEVVKQATIATRRPAVFRSFGNLTRVAPPPRGQLELPDLDRWAPHGPSEVFVGQKRALAQLLSDLGKPGLVHVHGLPGSGKTELARAVLDRCRLARWPLGGTSFVRLEGISTSAGLMGALQAVAPRGMRVHTSADLLELGMVLGKQERLVVLDHVDEALAAEAVRIDLGAFLEGACNQPASRLRVLITSVHPEQWPWAHERVQPASLSEPEARKLLEGTVRGSFVVDAAQRDETWERAQGDPTFDAVVREIGGRALTVVMAGRALKNGVPLAVVRRTYASGGAPDLSPMLERLRAELEVRSPGISLFWWLVAELRGGLPGATLLSEEDQARLELLRQHSACDGDPLRYSVSQPVWHYLRASRGAAPLSGSEAGVRARLHAAVATALVELLQDVVPRLRGTQAAAAAHAFATFQPTIDLLLEPVNATAWAALVACRGRLTALAAEAANYAALPDLVWRWTESAPTSALEDGTREHVRLTRAAAAALRYDWPAAQELALAAQQAAASAGDPQLEARAWRQLADIEAAQGSPETLAAAGEHYRRAQDCFRQANDDIGRALCLCNLGWLARRRSEPTQAVQQYGAALALYRVHDDLLGEGRARRALGELAQHAGQLQEAHEHFAAAANCFERMRASLDLAAVDLNLGGLSLQRGDKEAAEAAFERARAVYENLGEPLGQANAWRSFGDLRRAQRKPAEATEAYERAQRFYDEAGHARGRSHVTLRLSEIALGEGHVTTALASATQVSAASDRLHDDVTGAAAYLLVGEAQLAAGDHEAARIAALEACQRALRAQVADTLWLALKLLSQASRRSDPVVARALKRLLASTPVPDPGEVRRVLGRLRQFE